MLADSVTATMQSKGRTMIQMKEMLEIGGIALGLIKAYPTSLFGGFKYRRLFENVETYCMFIGFSRSGKTLLSSLLDAHPNMIVANELSALMYIHAGFSRMQIYYLLLENSRSFTKTGRASRGYSFQVPNQWQGRSKQLRVIGDNQGEGATLRLRARPWLLQRLRNTVGENVRFILVIRNPYDNISALLTRRDLNLDLNDSIEHHFSLCETVAGIKKRIENSELFELRYESLVASPKTCLEELCRFLGVDAPSDYLDDCANILFESPIESRHDVQWNRELVGIVRDRIEHFPFLQGYSFES